MRNSLLERNMSRVSTSQAASQCNPILFANNAASLRKKSILSQQLNQKKDQQQRTHSIFSADGQLPPILQINFESQSNDINMFRNNGKVYKYNNHSPGKKQILLKKQMSESRFQEYKRQQIHQMTEQMKNETVDSFLVNHVGGKNSYQQVNTNHLNKLPLKTSIKIDDDGVLQKRSILGQPDTFQTVQKKIVDIQNRKKAALQNGLQSGIQGLLNFRSSNISTPKSKPGNRGVLRINSGDGNFGFQTHVQMQNQQKGVNFANTKPQPKPHLTVTNQQIEDMKKQIEDKIKENESMDQSFTMNYLPLSIQLRESKSQRILDQFSATKNYWDKQKAKFSYLSHKDHPSQGLMHSTDDYRKKVEASELIDKSNQNVESMGQTLWKANLRNYHFDAQYKLQPKTYIKKSNQTEEAVRRRALKEQELLEQKEFSKTFLQLESLNQCADITSVYLDKSFKPTEIIRTPNFEQARAVDLMSSTMYKDSVLNEQSVGMQSHTYQHPWWNDTIREEVIQEETQEDEQFHQTEESIINRQQLTQSTLRLNQQKRTSSIRVDDVETGFINRLKSTSNLMRTSQNISLYNQSSNYTSMMSRRKRETFERLDKTIREVKKEHDHLISPVNDDDAMLLCVQGISKLEIEAEAAKKINGPKVLLEHEAINGEDGENENRERDEMIAFHYDQKLFY